VSDERDGVSADGPTSGDGPSGDEATARADAPAGRDKPRQAPSLSKSDSAAVSADDQEPGSGSGADEPADAEGGSALTTPASPGSARAAARRAAARAGTSDKKGAATPKRGSTTAVKKPNPIARLGRFLREVVAELRKVIWPTRNQMVTYTIVVIVFVVFMVALVGVLDLLFAKGVFAVFG
jgi:preprotein translocase subunit SecE